MTVRFGIILLVIGLAGCIGGGAPAPHVHQYILEYPPPGIGGGAGTEALLKVERFTAARVHAGPAMLYRQGPFRRDAYSERRWRIAPGDMVTDFLLRDLRHAGLFRAVLAARDPEETRFVLMGGVDEFGEVADGERRKAVLAATVTLLDLSVRDIPDRVRVPEELSLRSAVRSGRGRGPCRGDEPGDVPVLRPGDRGYCLCPEKIII